jgi:hypothetical protein
MPLPSATIFIWLSSATGLDIDLRTSYGTFGKICTKYSARE